MFENKFEYLIYPFFCFLPVSTLRMETDGIGMEIDLDILDIHLYVSFSFPSSRMEVDRIRANTVFFPFLSYKTD